MRVCWLWHRTLEDERFWKEAYCNRWRKGHPADVSLSMSWKALYQMRSLGRTMQTRMVSRPEGDWLYLQCTRAPNRWNSGQQIAVGQDPVPYFEVRVEGGASVGMAGEQVAVEAGHVGWQAETFGYHSDDGSFWSHGRMAPYGPPYGERTDIIGCGVTPSRAVFFTKNGRLLGNAVEVATAQTLLPAVALHDRGDQAWVNLGLSPFLFDIEKHLEANGYGGGQEPMATDPTR